jgi:short-subunit dehydrogenase
MKKAIIIGGTSGIGRALAEKLVLHNWKVAITGRRTALLDDIKSQSNNTIITASHDVTKIDTSEATLNDLFQQLGHVDLVVVSSGLSALNSKLHWDLENKVIQTNVNGVAKIYGFVFSKFTEQGFGHLVGISSLAALRGNRMCASYSASKAFQANYLEAMRGIAKRKRLKIKITDIQPGFVDTPMAKGDALFWVVPVKKAADQIFIGIQKGKRKIYISKRWRLVAWIMKLMPSWLLEKL